MSKTEEIVKDEIKNEVQLEAQKLITKLETNKEMSKEEISNINLRLYDLGYMKEESLFGFKSSILFISFVVASVYFTLIK